VQLVDGRNAVVPIITRLNRRFESVLRLAELNLRHTGLDAPRGTYQGTAFIFDMNRVLEDFVTAALREPLDRAGLRFRAQWEGFLDAEGSVRIRPDITLWRGTHPVLVADAKYKALRPTGFPNADIYQMHAYCTALGLNRGFLIYAKQGGEESRAVTITRGGPRIIVQALDVELEPADLIKQTGELAEEMLREVPAN
jgi:5-methylcytosine-specific restriction enzyme subunit McrC